uniref:HCP-like protein n=1 Tax=Rhizophagus irregularis (strain DAOM 181602 / DAOM 197198 / MUCL 43194) TaxID=747089 RepID=U9STP2_RHIID
MVDEIVELSDKAGVEYEELERLCIYNYLNNHNMTSQEIYIWLLNNQNHSNSIVLLGDFNYLGIEINIDKKKAFELYQIAANSGNIIAQYNLGCCYIHGNGVYKDDDKAFELFKKLAEREYSNGIRIGTDIDKQKAFELYQESANFGNSSAQYNLALMYENGEGIKKDINQATYWYNKSAEQGDQGAQNKLNKLNKRKWKIFV